MKTKALVVGTVKVPQSEFQQTVPHLAYSKYHTYNNTMKYFKECYRHVTDKLNKNHLKISVNLSYVY